jgi:Flp pilus assembly protein TadG
MSLRLGDESGSALIELAMLLPVLTGFFLGGVGLSFAISEAMTVSQAAEAGALYGSLAGNNTDLSGMQNAATNAAGGLSGFQAVATNFCSCTAGGSVVSCSSSCPSGTQFEYVKVQTSATVPMLTQFPGLGSAANLSGLSVLRVH